MSDSEKLLEVCRLKDCIGPKIDESAQTGFVSMQHRQARKKPSKRLVKVLASNVRALRHAQGVSQEELAASCGLHRTYVGSIERGERNATLSTLEVLASVLGVTVPQLLTPQRPNDTEPDPAD